MHSICLTFFNSIYRYCGREHLYLGFMIGDHFPWIISACLHVATWTFDRGGRFRVGKKNEVGNLTGALASGCTLTRSNRSTLHECYTCCRCSVCHIYAELRATATDKGLFEAQVLHKKPKIKSFKSVLLMQRSEWALVLRRYTYFLPKILL